MGIGIRPPLPLPREPRHLGQERIALQRAQASGQRQTPVEGAQASRMGLNYTSPTPCKGTQVPEMGTQPPPFQGTQATRTGLTLPVALRDQASR